VLRVDRKVGLELLNDVAFLLESQVMQHADATTPMRQLYFIVQLMLMDPADVWRAEMLFRDHTAALRSITESAELTVGLTTVEKLVEAGRYYEALKNIRALFVAEAAILAASDRPGEAA
jgi:flagellar protein FlbT